MKKLLIGLTLLMGATVAAAQDQGFYVGGHIGQSMYRSTCDELGGPGISCDDKDTAWKILGGYQFDRRFAVEIGYTNLGEVSARGPGGTASAEASAFEIVGVGTLAINEKFAVYGKLGVYRGEVDGRINTFTVTGSASESNTDITGGFGVRFNLTRNVALRGEWQRYPDMGGPDVGEDDIDVISIGVLFRF